ncbi:unnamed protein product [Prunus armeniaca]
MGNYGLALVLHILAVQLDLDGKYWLFSRSQQALAKDNLRQLTFWGLKFCKMHEVDGTPRCSGCNRFKVGRKTFIRNGNGEELGSPSPCCL